jgi:hypothetical protein
LLEFLGPIQHNAHYATGMRRSELAHLKVSDHDSQRMIIRVVEGKGGKDRDLPLSRTLLETLREYWRWRKPRFYLFPPAPVAISSISRFQTRPSGLHVAMPRGEPASANASGFLLVSLSKTPRFEIPARPNGLPRGVSDQG